MKFALMFLVALASQYPLSAVAGHCSTLLSETSWNLEDNNFIIEEVSEDQSLKHSFSLQGRVPSAILSALRITSKPDEFLGIMSHYEPEPLRHLPNDERAHWESIRSKQLEELTNAVYRILNGDTGIRIKKSQLDLLRFLFSQV